MDALASKLLYTAGTLPIMIQQGMLSPDRSFIEVSVQIAGTSQNDSVPLTCMFMAMASPLKTCAMLVVFTLILS